MNLYFGKNAEMPKSETVFKTDLILRKLTLKSSKERVFNLKSLSKQEELIINIFHNRPISANNSIEKVTIVCNWKMP